MKVELSNGYAEIKDSYKRGLAKKLEKIMIKAVSITSDGDKATASDIKADTIMEGNDLVFLEMITKLVINDEEKKVTIEEIDELENADYQKIKKAIDKISSPEQEKKD